jgi:hypothetical protein
MFWQSCATSTSTRSGLGLWRGRRSIAGRALVRSRGSALTWRTGCPHYSSLSMSTGWTRLVVSLLAVILLINVVLYAIHSRALGSGRSRTFALYSELSSGSSFEIARTVKRRCS